MTLRVNGHGVFGLAAIIAMFGIALSRGWNIPWLYFVASIVLYAIVVISLSLLIESGEPDADLLRPMIGAHLAFVFLVVGLLFDFQSFFVSLGYFVASIAMGVVIPYLVLSKR